MAKAILIDTDNLDLAKLGEVFGNDVAEAIASAIGQTFNASATDEVDEDGCDGCDECEQGGDDEEVEEESTFGNVLLNDENANRYKVVFDVNGCETDSITVTETEQGVRVVADNGVEEFEEECVASVPFLPGRTSVHLFNGELTIRLYKNTLGVANVGREIPVQG